MLIKGKQDSEIFQLTFLMPYTISFHFLYFAIIQTLHFLHTNICNVSFVLWLTNNPNIRPLPHLVLTLDFYWSHQPENKARQLWRLSCKLSSPLFPHKSPLTLSNTHSALLSVSPHSLPSNVHLRYRNSSSVTWTATILTLSFPVWQLPTLPFCHLSDFNFKKIRKLKRAKIEMW